jgi:hypothetical protein
MVVANFPQTLLRMLLHHSIPISSSRCTLTSNSPFVLSNGLITLKAWTSSFDVDEGTSLLTFNGGMIDNHSVYSEDRIYVQSLCSEEKHRYMSFLYYISIECLPLSDSLFMRLHSKLSIPLALKSDETLRFEFWKELDLFVSSLQLSHTTLLKDSEYKQKRGDNELKEMNSSSYEELYSQLTLLLKQSTQEMKSTQNNGLFVSLLCEWAIMSPLPHIYRAAPYVAAHLLRRHLVVLESQHAETTKGFGPSGNTNRFQREYGILRGPGTINNTTTNNNNNNNNNNNSNSNTSLSTSHRPHTPVPSVTLTSHNTPSFSSWFANSGSSHPLTPSQPFTPTSGYQSSPMSVASPASFLSVESPATFRSHTPCSYPNTMSPHPRSPATNPSPSLSLGNSPSSSRPLSPRCQSITTVQSVLQSELTKFLMTQYPELIRKVQDRDDTTYQFNTEVGMTKIVFLKLIFKNICCLFGELIRSKIFHFDALYRTLIARGIVTSSLTASQIETSDRDLECVDRLTSCVNPDDLQQDPYSNLISSCFICFPCRRWLNLGILLQFPLFNGVNQNEDTKNSINYEFLRLLRARALCGNKFSKSQFIIERFLLCEIKKISASVMEKVLDGGEVDWSDERISIIDKKTLVLKV